MHPRTILETLRPEVPTLFVLEDGLAGGALVVGLSIILYV